MACCAATVYFGNGRFGGSVAFDFIAIRKSSSRWGGKYKSSFSDRNDWITSWSSVGVGSGMGSNDSVLKISWWSSMGIVGIGWPCNSRRFPGKHNTSNRSQKSSPKRIGRIDDLWTRKENVNWFASPLIVKSTLTRCASMDRAPWPNAAMWMRWKVWRRCESKRGNQRDAYKGIWRFLVGVARGIRGRRLCELYRDKVWARRFVPWYRSDNWWWLFMKTGQTWIQLMYKLRTGFRFTAKRWW